MLLFRLPSTIAILLVSTVFRTASGCKTVRHQDVPSSVVSSLSNSTLAQPLVYKYEPLLMTYRSKEDGLVLVSFIIDYQGSGDSKKVVSTNVQGNSQVWIGFKMKGDSGVIYLSAAATESNCDFRFPNPTSIDSASYITV